MKKISLMVLVLFSFSSLALKVRYATNGKQTSIDVRKPTTFDLNNIRVIKGGGGLKRCDDLGEISLEVTNDTPGRTGNACPEVVKMLKEQVFQTKGDTLVISAQENGNCLGLTKARSYLCMKDNL